MADQPFLPEVPPNVLTVYAHPAGRMPTARQFASAVRGEGISVQWPGLPFGENIAAGADYLAGLTVRAFGGTSDVINEEYNQVTDSVKEAIGTKVPGPITQRRPPKVEPGAIGAGRKFQVSMPGWSDFIVLPDVPGTDDPASKQRRREAAMRMARSPVPPNVRKVAEILTTADNLQDDASTLTVALAVVEKAAGRAVPGLGQLAMGADALNLITGFGGPAASGRMPGKAAKRAAVEKAKSTSGGYAGRIDELRRTGKFGLNAGDLIQGLQSAGNWAGVGIQLGAAMGLIQDAAFGLVRGATFKVPTRVPGLVGIGQDLLRAQYRSPSIMDVHPDAPDFLSTIALGVWRKLARISPWMDQFDEGTLLTSLVGMRLAENVLGPWLRGGSWVPVVRDLVALNPPVAGSGGMQGESVLSMSKFVGFTAPAATAAIQRAIANVPDRGRQAFYDSLVASIGWGLLGSIEPDALMVEHGPHGAGRDAFTLLEAGKIPRFDYAD